MTIARDLDGRMVNVTSRTDQPVTPGNEIRWTVLGEPTIDPREGDPIDRWEPMEKFTPGAWFVVWHKAGVLHSVRVTQGTAREFAMARWETIPASRFGTAVAIDPSTLRVNEVWTARRGR